METTIIETYNDGSNDVFFKKYADAIRKRRNEILQDTDHKILLDSSLSKTSSSNMKIYRQE